jgi:hypothetical protein
MQGFFVHRGALLVQQAQVRMALGPPMAEVAVECLPTDGPPLAGKFSIIRNNPQNQRS